MTLYSSLVGPMLERKLLTELNALVEPYCERCDGRCCTGALTGELILEKGEEKLFRDLEEKDREERRGLRPYLLRQKDRTSLMLPGRNQCPFLKKGKCSIHNKRPKACRYYPFYIEKGSLFVKRGCKAVENQEFLAKAAAFAASRGKKFGVVEIK